MLWKLKSIGIVRVFHRRQKPISYPRTECAVLSFVDDKFHSLIDVKMPTTNHKIYSTTKQTTLGTFFLLLLLLILLLYDKHSIPFSDDATDVQRSIAYSLITNSFSNHKNKYAYFIAHIKRLLYHHCEIGPWHLQWTQPRLLSHKSEEKKEKRIGKLWRNIAVDAIVWYFRRTEWRVIMFLMGSFGYMDLVYFAINNGISTCKQAID